MTTYAYATTVRLLLPVDVKSEGEACDAVSSLLTEQGVYEGALLDWCYLAPHGGPERVLISNDHDRDHDEVPGARTSPTKITMTRDLARELCDQLDSLLKSSETVTTIHLINEQRGLTDELTLHAEIDEVHLTGGLGNN